MSGNLLQLLGMAGRLDEIHQLVVRLYGENEFTSRVNDFEPLLRGRAKEKHDGNLISAAINLVKDETDERMVLLIMAVSVELVRRENAAAAA